jgi:tetratricopeptide (TPR) repeat protein
MGLLEDMLPMLLSKRPYDPILTALARLPLAGALAVALALSSCATSAPSAPPQKFTYNDSDIAPGATTEEMTNRSPASSGTASPTAAAPSKADVQGGADYHFSLAQAYVAEGNPDRAIEEYKLTLMFDPNSPLVYTRLAAEYVKKGMMSAALETCKAALQLDPNFTDARLIAAGLYAETHDTTTAVHEYDLVLKKDPQNEEAAVYKSQALFEGDQPEQAVKTLKVFVAKNPESALGYYYLGHLEQEEEHAPAAIAAYKKSLKLRPGFSQAALSLGYLYEEGGKNKDAVAVYQQLFEDTQDTTAADRLATIYLKQEHYEQAVPYLEAIRAADPDSLNTQVKLGLIRMELKQYDQAIALFKAILEKTPDADRVLYYLGSIYEETQQIDKSVDTLKKIPASSKLYGEAVMHVAYLLKQEKKLKEARNYIHETIQKTPDYPTFYIFEASMDEDAKNFDGAIGTLAAAQTRFPDNEGVIYYLGSLYDRKGDTDKGLEYMEKILTINPNNVDALNYIGYTWTTKGIRLDDAGKVLAKALSLKPDNAYIQDSWGYYLFVRGRNRDAIVALEKAAQTKPDEATILEHLGDAYLKANLEEKALAQYSNAARFAEDEASRRKLVGKVTSLRTDLAQKGKISPETGQETGPERLPAAERTGH